MKMTFLAIIITGLTFASAKAEHKVIDVDSDINFRDPWYKKSRSDEENFKHLIDGLKNTRAGTMIVQKATEKAAQRGMTLLDVVASGEGSLTDTTLVRKFSATNPADVIYETRSKVYINRRLNTLDALLDFAHELTHFSYREAFNPYDARFALKDFIKSTVEGKGGEVDAFIVECKVYSELVPGLDSSRSNCQRLYDKKTGSVSKELGVQEFYKVGQHFDFFKKEIGKFALNEKDLPETSGSEAIFISSAWGLPYPVAAIREYTNIMDRVCRNDQNRLTLLQNKLGRSPASSEEGEQKQTQTAYRTMFEDFKVRCQKFATI